MGMKMMMHRVFAALFLLLWSTSHAAVAEKDLRPGARLVWRRCRKKCCGHTDPSCRKKGAVTLMWIRSVEGKTIQLARTLQATANEKPETYGRNQLTGEGSPWSAARRRRHPQLTRLLNADTRK